jgi:hypothetical protein
MNEKVGPANQTIWRMVARCGQKTTWPRKQHGDGADTGIGVLVKTERAAEVRESRCPDDHR